MKQKELQVLEQVKYMFYSEVKRRNLILSEEDLRDLEQSVLMWALDAMRRLYDSSKKTKLSSYLWFVIDSALKDYLYRSNRVSSYVSIEEMREDEDGKERDWYLEDRREESFSVKLLRILFKYKIGEDLFRLLIGDVDVPNIIRSVSASRVKGERWIEKYLNRELSEEERKCLEEVRVSLFQ